LVAPRPVELFDSEQLKIAGPGVDKERPMPESAGGPGHGQLISGFRSQLVAYFGPAKLTLPRNNCRFPRVKLPFAQRPRPLVVAPCQSGTGATAGGVGLFLSRSAPASCTLPPSRSRATVP